MTSEEIEISKALNICTYLPGSYEKRFARAMASIAEYNPSYDLTEKQRVWLYKQLKRYRKQIPVTFNKYGKEL